MFLLRNTTTIPRIPILDDHQEEVIHKEEEDAELESPEVVERFKCLSLLYKRDFVSKGEKIYAPRTPLQALCAPKTPARNLQILDEHQEKQQLKKEEEEENEEEEEDEEVESHEVVDRFKCLTLLHKRDFVNRGEKLYGEWKQDQKLRAARMEHHLGEGWALDKLIEEQLSRFDAHYSRTMGQCKPKDVSQLLIPKCRLPLEMATLAWLGNWRPSAILTLLQSISRSSSAAIRVDKMGHRILSQLIRDTRIEEAVLDEEMAEIQATCILHLPFSPRKKRRNLACLHSEFKKIHRVITQAQKLRYKTLALVVKKLLNRPQAAEFLVAFAGIQDMVHEYAASQKRQKGPVSVTIKPFGA